jgi:hypothetical protein
MGKHVHAEYGDIIILFPQLLKSVTKAHWDWDSTLENIRTSQAVYLNFDTF